MISLLSISDFQTAPYKILVGKNMPEDKLTNEIHKRQKEFLLKILGYQEYYNLENDNAGLFPTTQKWIDFINGVVYNSGSYVMDYKGILEPLKLYTYYFYQRNNFVQPGTFGGVKMEIENGYLKLESDKMVQAWNEMVYLIGQLPTNVPTAYNYLNDNDFNADMQIFTKINDIF